MIERSKSNNGTATYSSPEIEYYKQLVQGMSEITNRLALAAKFGDSFNGDRNLYTALGYPTDIRYEEYKSRYSRQDIAKAVIDRPVNATWQGKLELEEPKKKNDTELEKEFKLLVNKMKLKSKFSRVDKLAGLGCYAILLLGFNDSDYSVPIAKGKKRKLLYVKPVSEKYAKIDEYVNDPQDERYGLPFMYMVTIVDMVQKREVSMKVHYSRVLHIVSEPLESEVIGAPRLEVIYNRLMDLEKIVGGDSEMFWKGARPGYSAIAEKDYKITPTLKADLKKQLDEYEHNLRRFLTGEGIKIEGLAPQISDPSNHVDIQIQMISAVTGIPKRILTGSERGQLASEQDASEWKAFVQIRREEYANDTIVRPFVDIMIDYGVLPEPASKEYIVKWSDIFAISEADRVKIGASRASALKDYTANPMAQEVIPPEGFMEIGLGMTSDQIELMTQMRSDSQLSAIALEQRAMQNIPDNGQPGQAQVVRGQEQSQVVRGPSRTQIVRNR